MRIKCYKKAFLSLKQTILPEINIERKEVKEQSLKIIATTQDLSTCFKNLYKTSSSLVRVKHQELFPSADAIQPPSTCKTRGNIIF